MRLMPLDCFREKIKLANPGFLDSTLALLVTHGMADHKLAVEYVFQGLGRSLPQVQSQPATVCLNHLMLCHIAAVRLHNVEIRGLSQMIVCCKSR